MTSRRSINTLTWNNKGMIVVHIDSTSSWPLLHYARQNLDNLKARPLNETLPTLYSFNYF